MRELIQTQKENDDYAASRLAAENKRLTRSSASKENDYQGPSNQYYYSEPVQSKVTLISDHRTRCQGNNCSQMAAEGDVYCRACRLVRQQYYKPAPATTRTTDYYSAPDPQMHLRSNQREIPIQIVSSTNSNFHSASTNFPSSTDHSSSSSSRTHQIPITRHKEPLGSSTMTNQSKLYNTNLAGSSTRIPVNLNSAYNIYDRDPTNSYDNLGRRSRPTAIACSVCRSPMSYNEYMVSQKPGLCPRCYVESL